MFLFCRSCRFLLRAASSPLPISRRNAVYFYAKSVYQGVVDFRYGIRQFSSTSQGGSDVVLRPTSTTDEEKTSSSSSTQATRDVHSLLNLITEKVAARGTNLVFSDSFLDNLDKSPLSLILNSGPNLKMDYIAEAFSLRPKFLEIPTHRWEEILKIFQDANISMGIVLAALVGHPQIFEVQPSEINATLVELGTLGIRDRVLHSVLAKHPQILSADLNKINEFVQNMLSFFPRTKLMVIIRKEPHLLFTNFDKIEAKYEYIYNEMGLEPYHIIRSTMWYRMDLTEIECRHQFLIRCGVYVTPDEKKTEIGLENPSLRYILDTDDEEFCRVAGVSLMEWETYKKIYDDEEPFEPTVLNEEYLRRTRRIAPKVNEEDNEWRDVPLEELEDDDEDDRRRGKYGKMRYGRDGGNEDGRAWTTRGRRGRENRALHGFGEFVREDSVHQSSVKKRTEMDSSDEVYRRQLTATELAQLKARIDKMRVAENGYFENVDDAEDDDDDEEELLLEEAKEEERHKHGRQANVKKMDFMMKRQFRKRGVFLASED